MESFLATDAPVWVWDGQGRRILWANEAAAKLWGDPSPERLKRRRTSGKSGAASRMTDLARSGEPLGDHVETLRLPGAGGGVPVACVFQRLQLAGDRPGLVVRVLPAREDAEESGASVTLHPAVKHHEHWREQTPASTTHPTKTRAARKTASQSDRGALEAIAKDIGDATGRSGATTGKAGAQRKTTAKSASGTGGGSRSSQQKTSGKPKSGAQPAKRGPSKPAAEGKSAKPSTTQSPAEPPSSEEMAALLARVSHEIRNPLTIIVGFAEILQSDRVERLKPGKAREYASDIYRTAQLALGLADDLLGFAERVSGEPPPPHDWMDMNAVIADCLQLLAPLAAAHGVTLTRSLKRGGPWLLAHERSMRQILLNLLMNALRHGDGGGKIRVSTRLDREGGLVLSVKDNGPGMTPEQIAAAKAPEEATDVKQAGRRGLGLRLVLGFVRDNQGELDIISKPGDGTDMRIRFAPDRLRPPEPKTASETVKASHAKTGAKATKTTQKETPAKSKTAAKTRKSPGTQKAAKSKTPAKGGKRR